MVSLKSIMIPAEKFVVVDCETNVRRTSEIMRDRRIGSVFVARGKEVIGIVTEPDITGRVVGMGLNPDDTAVERIMSTPILTIDENKTIREANAMMAKEHVRHLGVSRDGMLVGMLSVTDLIRFVSNLPRKWILGAGGRHILEQIYGHV